MTGTQSNALSTMGTTELSSGSASPLMIQVSSIQKVEDKCLSPVLSR